MSLGTQEEQESSVSSGVQTQAYLVLDPKVSHTIVQIAADPVFSGVGDVHRPFRGTPTCDFALN